MRKLAAGLLAIAGILSIGLFSGCVRKSDVDGVEIRNAPEKEGTVESVRSESAASAEAEPADVGAQGDEVLREGEDSVSQSNDVAENGDSAAEGGSSESNGDNEAQGEGVLLNEEGEDLKNREHAGRIRRPERRGDKRMGKKKGKMEGDEDVEEVIREYRKLPADGRAVALYGIRALYGVESY